MCFIIVKNFCFRCDFYIEKVFLFSGLYFCKIIFFVMQVENLKKKLFWLKYEQKKVFFQVLKEKEKEVKLWFNVVVEKFDILK